MPASTTTSCSRTYPVSRPICRCCATMTIAAISNTTPANCWSAHSNPMPARGESTELKNFFVAAGLNSIGLQSAGGIGKVVSEWIRDGHPPVDLWEVDVRRNMPFQINRRYLRARVSESLGLLYATHWPFRQYETARGARKSTLHDRLG